ncbi:hypothetical protein FOA52_008256 [Chlamydomonas sp. UWO 241]|nr:hypothetical protein FOA52_008256 [Chlamydomonas sp. UWO 241]
MGLLDVLGYGLSCLGFARCGAALSMVLGAAAGQVATAAARTLLLRKPLSARRTAAVAVVSAGLAVRGAGSVVRRPRPALPPVEIGSLASGAAAGTSAAATASSTAAATATGIPAAASSAAAAAAAATAGARAVWFDARTASGAALIVLGAVCYSLLGVAYEWLCAGDGGEGGGRGSGGGKRDMVGGGGGGSGGRSSGKGKGCGGSGSRGVEAGSGGRGGSCGGGGGGSGGDGARLSQPTINRAMAWVGALAVTAYQLFHTLPRWGALVARPVAESGLGWHVVVVYYLAFGVVFTGHSHMQGHVLGTQGAVVVGIVSATRALFQGERTRVSPV